ncbi:insulinase family protein [bacterium]|nr:insulinase family protein [bacterium]
MALQQIHPTIASSAMHAKLVAFLLIWSLITVSTLKADDPPKEAQAGRAVAAQAADGTIMKLTEVEGITEYELENGVRVLLFPDASKEVVTVNMTVFVGSRHEGYGEAGMAHLLEHMLFKGTPSNPDIPKALKDRGAGRSMNGTTWMDRTNYYETLPATGDNLEFAIQLEADRLVNSKILGEDLASEMTVVRNEFESGENSPFRVLMQRMQAAAYEWHNYGQTTIGNRSDIERVPVVKLRQFYRKFYRPDNVMVIVAGKFEQKEALSYLKKYFGALSNPETPLDDTYTTEPAQDGERTVVVRRVGETQLVGNAYHIPSGSHPDYAAAKALVYILSDQPTGRMYKGLVESEIATSVYALANAFAEPGLFMTLAEVPGDGSIEKARLTMNEIVEQSFRDDPVTETEVKRAVQQILKARELETSDSDRIAISLSDWAAQGDWRLYFMYRDNIESLTREQVQQVAEKYFVRNNRTTGLFIPSEESDRISIPEAPDIAAMLDGYKGREAVAAGEQIDPEPTAIEKRTLRGKLTGGVEYAFLPKRTRGETVSMQLTLRFGNGESLKGKLGAVELLGILMARGTEKYDYTELQDELNRLRIEMSMSSTVGVLQVGLKTKREYLPEAITLLGDVLRHPRLDGDELEVMRRQIITSLQQGTTEPQSVAPRSVRRSLSPYAKDDVRYVMSAEEEIDMYKKVTVDEIRALHAGFLSNQAGEVSAVGDFDPDELKALLNAQLADWETDESFARVDRKAHPDVEQSLDIIETPDKANAFYFSSQQYNLKDSDPQYASLVLGNYILGGGSLSSRLGNRVRQQEGLSYGVRSGISARAKDGRVDFTLYAITNPKNRDKLMAVMLEELEKIRKDGVTQEELDEAKVAYLQAARVRRSGDSALTSELLSTLFNDRTMAHYAEHDAQIEAATVESVNKAINKYIDPDKLIMAVAGDFAAASKERAEKE